MDVEVERDLGRWQFGEDGDGRGVMVVGDVPTVSMWLPTHSCYLG